MSNKQQRRTYKKISAEFYIQQLMDYYHSCPSLGFRAFCNQCAITNKHNSLLCIARKINLFGHKEAKTPYNFVHQKLRDHLKKKEITSGVNLDKLHENNRSLTEDEEKVLVSTCIQMAAMGLGIDTDTCLVVVNSILARRIDTVDFVPVCVGVVIRIISRNSELLRLVRGNSIDPKRVRQADQDVRNAMFVKLDNMIKLLHNQGKVPWSSLAEVPGDCLSNMDKLAVNAHSHRKKVIAPVSSYLDEKGRLYQETSSGDSKMPFHITIALTTTANGKLNYAIFILRVNDCV